MRVWERERQWEWEWENLRKCEREETKGRPYFWWEIETHRYEVGRVVKFIGDSCSVLSNTIIRSVWIKFLILKINFK